MGTGRAVFDNKGQPVKQYEPYFSSVPDFEDEDELVTTGVTPILRYDPLGRLTRTDLPDGTYARTRFDAWRQMAWDPNDTTGDPQNAWVLARDPNLHPEVTPQEQDAATLALGHADTPTTSHIDALGRVFLVQARLTALGVEPAKIVETRTEMDIEGQVLAVRDALGADSETGALGRVCAENKPALGGQTIWSSHIDSGKGYVLNDVKGAPLYAWDAAGHRVRTQVDAVRRVTHVWVQTGNQAEWLSQRSVYGEAVDDPETFNLRGKVLYHFDGAGLVASGTYDFKGNLLSSSRRLCTTYDAEPSWTVLAGISDPAAVLAAAESAGLLESETFAKSTAYDALNRPIAMTQPDASVIFPLFNEAGLLDGVDVKIRGAATVTSFVANIDYDVKGRRERIEYGNGTLTTYDYDPRTYRLTRIQTTRTSDNAVLQNLAYTYDPVGNILAIADTAHESVFFAGQQVNPSAEYEYDALYRLVKATGREHAGGVGDNQRDANDLPLWNLPHPNDAQALRNYVEHYHYDLVGNLEKLVHTAVNSAVGSWTRHYAYGDAPFAQNPPAVAENNRLHSTSLPGDAATGPFSATYTHDANGNLVTMPHLAAIEYTVTNQMRLADLGGGGTAYYTYDASGERVRKVIQRLGTTREERIYLGGFELYRKRQGANHEIVLERETLHVMDDARRIAMVETKTVDAEVPGPLTVVSRIRYQLDNHLGTATLEVDETGLVISYEEYHPYGTSAYRSARSGVEVSEKRYRYTGKERDQETGFGYHSARYYAPWLARWTSADPKGMVDGPSLFCYGRSSPIVLNDPTGRQSPEGPIIRVPNTIINIPVEERLQEVVDNLVEANHSPLPAKPPGPSEDMAEFSVPMRTVCHGGCHGYSGVLDPGTGLIAYGTLGGVPLKGDVDPAVLLQAGANAAVGLVTGTLRLALPFTLGLPEYDRAESKLRPFRYRSAQDAAFALPIELGFQFLLSHYVTKSLLRAPTDVPAAQLPTSPGPARAGATGAATPFSKLSSLSLDAVDESHLTTKQPIAVGLSSSPTHRKGLVGRFAEKVGATTYWDEFPDDATSNSMILDRMLSQFRQRRIAVNLSGLGQMAGEPHAGLAEILREPYKTVTEAEISHILLNEEFFNKSTFYRNGKELKLDRARIIGAEP